MECLSFGPYFSNTNFVLNIKHYLEIISLLYLNHETVQFDKILRSKCKNKIILLKKYFRFYMRFFRVNDFFLGRNFVQKYEVVNI